MKVLIVLSGASFFVSLIALVVPRFRQFLPWALLATVVLAASPWILLSDHPPLW
jgi:hypothetical protein